MFQSLAGFHINDGVGSFMTAGQKVCSNAVIGGSGLRMSALGDACGNTVSVCSWGWGWRGGWCSWHTGGFHNQLGGLNLCQGFVAHGVVVQSCTLSWNSTLGYCIVGGDTGKEGHGGGLKVCCCCGMAFMFC
jgi:hypothetical protein